MFTVGVLGPLQLAQGGASVPIRSAKQRALLGLLALHPNQVVARSAIVDAIWGRAAPAVARNTVQVQVSRLRQRLGPSAVAAVHDGYRLRVAEHESDLLTFRALAAHAADLRVTDPAAACDRYIEALRLWRAPVLTDIEPLSRSATAAAVGLERLLAVAGFADAAEAAGRHAEALPFLHEAAGAQPLNGALHARLMLALAATGQQAAALEVYAGVRDRLADELGVDPDPALREAHLRIIRQEVGERPAVSVGPAAAGPPRQMPAVTPHFVGRAAALDFVTIGVTGAGPRVTIISGGAGVGKTAVAVHWAGRNVARFPDGQLYVNLRGYDPHAAPVAPDEAIRGLLESLGVPGDSIPAGPAAMAARYRSELAGRRVLVVLDNARDTAQIRPLLPGPGAAAVLVTSRSELAGLVVDGARTLRLGLLSRAEARELLCRRLGAERLAADAAATEAIVDRCARLPLALAVVAARATLQPRFPLDVFAGELAAPPSAETLEAFAGEDAGTDLRTVFDCSYRVLSPAAAALFSLTALHPGPDLTVAAAAALTGAPPAEARRLLGELCRANLVDQHRPGRYETHDLLRAYALELAAPEQPALGRLLDHYVHSAHAADRHLNESRDKLALPAAAAGSGPETFADAAAALAWLRAEDAVLLRMVRRAADAGADLAVRGLAWSLGTYLDRSGRGADQLAVQRLALEANERLGGPAELAAAHRLMGRACLRLKRWEPAIGHHEKAFDLAAARGDRVACGHTLINHASIYEHQGRYAEALALAERALEHYRGTGHIGEAGALNSVGWYHAKLGRFATALEHCGPALALHRAGADRSGTAATLDSLGYVHHHRGDHARALECYEEAIAIFQTTGDRMNEAILWRHRADSHRAAGDHEAARAALREALAILAALGDPGADEVRALLSSA